MLPDYVYCQCFLTNPGSVPSLYRLSEEVRLGRQNQDLDATNLQQPVCFEEKCYVTSFLFFFKGITISSLIFPTISALAVQYPPVATKA